MISERPQVFFNYFRQQFAQVTNPAIDSIRECNVMSLFEYIGRVGTGILTPDEDNCKMIRLPHPILTNTQLDMLCNIRYKGFNTIKLPMLFDIAEGKAAASNLRRALDELCRKAEQCVDDGFNYIILSDRDVDATHAAIPWNWCSTATTADFWATVGLLHDVDFEKWPEEHCKKAPELLAEIGCSDELIHAVCSHGFGLCCEVEPVHEMEKVLFAADELTGLIGAAARMRPSKSCQDMMRASRQGMPSTS